MRIAGLVAGSIGLLAVAYAGDRWIQEISMNLGIYGGAGDWQVLGLIASLVVRLVLLVGLAVLFSTQRDGAARSGSWALAGIGAVVGLLAPLLMGVNIAMYPDGLPFVYLNTETSPLWTGAGVFLLWTAIGLLVIGLAGLLAARGSELRISISSPVLAAGAVLLVLATYPLDALFNALFIELASGLDAYPAFMLVGLTMRIGVMAGFVVLLSWGLGRAASRSGGAALLVVGIVGFLVLPIVGLRASPMGPESVHHLTSGIDPGTSGRWMAGAILVVGAIALWRASRAAAPAATADATIAQDPDAA